jgi:single-strand DNA-binding protein
VTVNEVRLHGRWQGAVERELPSGDLLVTARVVVARPEGGVDALDCAVWPAGLRRRVLGWPDGTHVEVAGSLRRRFFRTPVGAASRYEVQVERIRRAPRSPGRRAATA